MSNRSCDDGSCGYVRPGGVNYCKSPLILSVLLGKLIIFLRWFRRIRKGVPLRVLHAAVWQNGL